MQFIDPDTVARVKEIDLLTYLQYCEPDELTRISPNTYSTKTHSSLKISNGKWMWWSRGIGGKNALDFLVKVKGMDFKDAVLQIAAFEKLPVTTHETKQAVKSFSLLPRAPNNDKVISYLLKRGISRTVIDYFINEDFIYQSLQRDNLVFVGYDEKHKPRYATVRGTESSRFFYDVAGSNKEFSFRLVNNDTDSVHLFESAIDLISYATLCEKQGSDYKSLSLVSLSGVYNQGNNEQIKIPVALSSYLEKHDTKTIHLHLDNDRAGHNAARALTNLLSNKYSVRSHFVPVGKDVNDYLRYTLNIPYKSQKERRDCR